MTYKLSLVAAWALGIAFGLFILAELAGFVYTLYLAATIHIPAW